MMNCRKIQKLLMTDYIDGELKEKMRIKILNHLAACEECRQFEKTLQKETVSLFKAAEKKTPPTTRRRSTAVKKKIYKPREAATVIKETEPSPPKPTKRQKKSSKRQTNASNRPSDRYARKRPIKRR